MTPPYRLDHLARPPAPRTVPDYLVAERGGVTVWWSNITRQGEWVLPRVFRAFTFMGNAEIDLTAAQMSAGASEIEVRCVFGNVEIRVPPDIRVLCDGDGMAGSFDIEFVGDTGTPAADAPRLLVTGSAWFGSVTVKVMGTPGPGWKEKLKSSWDFFYR